MDKFTSTSKYPHQMYCNFIQNQIEHLKIQRKHIGDDEVRLSIDEK